MTTGHPPVFDEQEFLGRVGGDIELAADVARLFLEDCPRRLAAMRDALGRSDAAALRAEAHGLKGAASNMSAAVLAESASHLEDVAGEERLDAAMECFGRVSAQAEDVLEAVRSFELTMPAR